MAERITRSALNQVGSPSPIILSFHRTIAIAKATSLNWVHSISLGSFPQSESDNDSNVAKMVTESIS